jgi:hypothetical protein
VLDLFSKSAFMKKSSHSYSLAVVFSILLFSLILSHCRKSENPIKFPKGTFPEKVVNMMDINSAYDDYNLDIHQLKGNSPIIFSSNRKSSGGQFDLEQALISFIFDQTTDSLELKSFMTDDAFLNKLIVTATTPGNDFGPYRFFSSVDGYEYMVLSSETVSGKLDLFYLRNRPVNGNDLPAIDGMHPVKLLNTASDDAYFCLNLNMDSAYFSSDRDGNFDIYLNSKPTDLEFSKWFNLEQTASTKVESLNSSGDDKCPLVYKKIMVFTSNRAGGLGGYDLYYSLLRNGKWSSPVNFGAGINTSYDEYRPVIGFHPDFTNNFLMFSSNRPGGKGGFDLYFTGVEFPVY